MNTCTDEFARLSAPLRGLRCDSSPFITLTNPLALQNWTLPVIEAVMVGGLIACLVHALRHYRRVGDPANLIVWLTGIVALLLIEPVAYFPQWFGLEHSLGLTFVHNQFSVQFLFDRLPLYIVAMYPVYGYVSYAVIQRSGIFAKYGTVVGATSAAFVFHCLFEVVDTVAPQLRWWAWNTELSTSTPALGVVPYLNLQAFTVCLPIGIVLFTRLLCRGGGRGRGRWFVVRTVLYVSLLVWPLQFLASAPATVVDLLGGSIEVARAISLWVYLVAMAATSAYAFVGAYRARRSDPELVPSWARGDYFPLAYITIYLIAGLAFWIDALPEYMSARNGLTAGGAPVGSLTYGVITFLLSIALTIGAYAGAGRRPLADSVANARADESRSQS